MTMPDYAALVWADWNSSTADGCELWLMWDAGRVDYEETRAARAKLEGKRVLCVVTDDAPWWAVPCQVVHGKLKPDFAHRVWFTEPPQASLWPAEAQTVQQEATAS